MPGALEGIRVVDFGQYVAGPLAAMLLADQGADVVRVDPPGGPRLQTPANATWGRGKRRITLDLKQEGDRNTARHLIANADVVIENFRAGVMERLGLGPDAMTAAYPRLIYCSLPGFASDDPRSDLPAWEGVVAAATDSYRGGGGSATDRPFYTALPLASNFAAFLGAVSVTMALIARERDGRGQRVEVPLFDAMFTAIGANGVHINDAPAGRRPDDFWGGYLQCADGCWVLLSPASDRFRRTFVAAAGIEDWEQDGMLDLRRMAADPALADEFRRRLRALFLTRTAQEWEDLGAAAGVPLARCRSAAEWMATNHARDAQIVIPVQDPVYGSMLQPGLPVRLSATPGQVRGPASRPDADRASILAELETARPAQVMPTTPPLRAPLEGLRVIDLTQVLAGPTSGRTLAEFGADVIKINSPREEGAGYRFNVHRYHTDVNRGKRTMLLDLKAKEGLDIFWQLVERADVVVQNSRLGVAERLGIGYEQVRARKPDIVYVSVNAYGYPGPWGARPGYEGQGQTVTGMAERAGGGGQPSLQPFAVNDYGTGLMAAFGAALALFHRQRTGQGQHAEAALAYTATLHQSLFFQDYPGKVWDEPRGREALGSGPLHRLYRASDGWFFVGAGESQCDRLAQVAGLEGIAGREGEALGEALETALATVDRSEWIARLTEAGIGAHALVPVGALMSDPWVVAHGLSVTRLHDTGQHITTIGPGARLARTPVQPGRPAASPGADAHDVLRELGREDDYERLLAEGVLLVEMPE